MRFDLSTLRALFRRDKAADRVVPPAGFTVTLTLFASGAMAFLAVFAMALSLAAGRLADQWGDELARAATVRIAAPASDIPAQTQAALTILSQTPGIAEVRALSLEQTRGLLTPWFGPDLPIDDLPVPQLIEIIEDRDGFDAQSLSLRLQAEVPGAVLDDHSRWRAPLVKAADRLRGLGWLALALLVGTVAAMITLAANAALSANAQVISVLRQVGATDDYIAGAFVRRFTLRALMGAAIGTGVGLLALLLLPSSESAGEVLTGLGLSGTDWVWPLFIPLFAAVVAYIATSMASRKVLEALA